MLLGYYTELLRCVRPYMAGVFRSARHDEANDRYLREANGRCRRIADVTDRGQLGG